MPISPRKSKPWISSSSGASRGNFRLLSRARSWTTTRAASTGSEATSGTNGSSIVRIARRRVFPCWRNGIDKSEPADHNSHLLRTGGPDMKTATVSKLKASLSEYLRQVKAGEEVLVTERGRPIAKLSPVAGSDVLADHLIEMEKHGLLKVGSGKLPKEFWRLRRPKDPKGLI